MSTPTPISPLLALSRVNFLESSMLCLNLSSALSVPLDNRQKSHQIVSDVRRFLPQFLDIDDLSQASPETILHFALLTIAPALEASQFVPPDEDEVSVYIKGARDVDALLKDLEDGRELEKPSIKKLQTFCRRLA